MPGTAADPVRLDHFQNIIEVGWSGDPTHISMSFGVTRENETTLDSSCTIFPAPPPGIGAHWDRWLTSSTHIFDPYAGGLNTFVTGARLRSDGTLSPWEPFQGNLVVSGHPSEHAITYGSRQYTDGGGTFGDGVDSWTISGGALFVDGLSGGSPFSPPNQLPSVKFSTSMSVGVHMESDTFTGGTDFCIFPSPRGRFFKCSGRTGGSPTPARTVHDQHAFDVSAMTVVFNGRTYNAIGAWADDQSVSISVLFSRSGS